MKNGQKSSLYGEVSPYSEEIPYSERFSQIHCREYFPFLKLKEAIGLAHVDISGFLYLPWDPDYK